MKKLILTVFTFLSLIFAPVMSYAEDVKIGVLYPLTGPVAQVGKDAVAAVKTALDIINNSHNIPGMPLAKDAGLKGLGGGKISIVVGDHGGKPDIGVGETEKMLNSDKVHAMFGAYYSSVTGAASQVTERAKIPWVNGESTSPKLTQRGFKYFFRVTPHDGEFTQLMYEFMNDFNKKGGKLKTIGILHEDTLWGSDSGGTQNKMAKKQGYKVVEKISYKAKTTSLTSEVQRLKAKNPDVLMPSSYTSDAYLFLNTAKELDYNPKLLVAQNAGYTDPKFTATMGSKAEGVITRSPFNTDLAKTIPLIGKVNDIFKKHSGGRDLSDVPARAFTGFMALAQAINIAGSTDPEAIRQALTQLDIGPEHLIVPYKGVKFGKDGQNTRTRGILMQVQNGKYCTVYPFNLASCKLKYPMPTWAEKK